MAAKKPVNIEAVTQFIRDNPNTSYQQFCKTSKLKISDCYYYILRRKITGGAESAVTASRKKRSSMYVRVFLTDSTGVPEVAKQLLRQFISALNTVGNSNLEMLEYTHPAKIEVREQKHL